MDRPVSLPGVPAWAPLLTQQVPHLQGVQTEKWLLVKASPPPLQLTSRAVTKDETWEEGGGPSGAYNH